MTAATATPSTTMPNEPSQQPHLYDPNRTIKLEQLDATLNLLVNPVWIFDYTGATMRWGNGAALEIFNASSVAELVGRDYSVMSEATVKRNEEILWTCTQGQRLTDQWTFYPKGQAKTLRVTIGGIRLLDDVKDDDMLPHVCFLVEGVPVEHKELDNELLRGVEMLRHLPIAVCQFDVQGNCMFQNPEACLLEENSTESVVGAEEEEKEAKIPTSTDTTTNDTKGKLEQSTDDNTSSTENSDESETVKDDDGDDPGSTTNPDPDNTKPTDDRKRTSSTADDKPAEDTTTTTSSTTPNATTPTTTTTHKKRKTSDCSLLHRFVDPKVGQQILQQLHASTSFELEAMIHTQKGPKWSAIQIRQANDPVTGQPVLLYSARDKTDAVQARKERQAREQKAEFFAIIAHEVRTPLHQVTGFVDLLDQTSLDPEQKSFVATLKTSTQGLMTVINDVLDFSKLEAGKLQLESIAYEPLSVCKGSLEAVRAQCEERNLYLKLDWDSQIPFRLQNDPNRLRQVLLNLLSNSVKFTKQGGITVQAKYLMDDPNNPQIQFSVKDTGIGISKAHLAIIFQKYQQAHTAIARNYGGTGLGLSICHLLTQMMGGKMGVDSVMGQGTSFWFVLPAQEPAAEIEPDYGTPVRQPQQEQKQHEEKECMEGGLNVLVAEDNKVNQKLVVKMLGRMGHTAAVAENGKEAIEMIRTQQFDICLMDIQMPVCDGFEATKRLRSMGYTDLPIFGLTASVGRSDYADLGFNDWLPKPIRMKELKTKLFQIKQQLQGDNNDHADDQQGPPKLSSE